MQQSRTIRFSQRLNELCSKLLELEKLRVQVDEAEQRARAAHRPCHDRVFSGLTVVTHPQHGASSSRLE
jgi:hypothetical protein